MPICFVIQPFDAGKFDKRFDDVYRPAIEAAGLDAYRVDRDPGVDVPIDAIEDGIRNATVCLSDITEITERGSLTGIGFSLGLHRLITRGFVEIREQHHFNDDEYSAAYLTDKAWGWIETHEDLFVIRRPPKPEPNPEDIPF